MSLKTEMINSFELIHEKNLVTLAFKKIKQISTFLLETLCEIDKKVLSEKNLYMLNRN